MKTKKRMKYPDGGMLTGGEDPKDPGTRLTAKQIKQKYKGNPYVVNGRETWGESLDKTLPLSPGTTVRTAITNASKVAGVDPSLLYSSAMEEGLGYALSQPGYASEAYVNWETKNKDLASKYKVDGFYNYGLDRFGEKGVVENLQKKGYLPKDFNNKYTVYDAINEKKERIKTAAFLSDQDALTAKAAMLRDTQDQLNSYTTKKGYKLTPEQMDFFALAGYNGGVGNMQKMIDSYNAKGYLKNNKFLDPTFKPASYNDIYTNVQRRIQNRNVLKAEGYLEDGGEIDPITGKEKGPTLNGAKNVGVDVWGNAMNSQVPINPNAPKDQQIFKIQDTPGTPVEPPEKIIPLAQFADEVAGKFGQKDLKANGQYVDDKGQVNTLDDAKDKANEVSDFNIEAANKWEKNKDNAEMIASTGITAINAFFNKKEAAKNERTNLRRAIMQETFGPVFNPYAEGTGSQAIMEHGGSIHIKPENRGKFTASAKRAGMGVQEFASHVLANKEDYSSTQVKRANFARNAAKWGEDGLSMEQGNQMNILDGGKAEQISGPDNPLFEFKGKSHAEGGIGIEFGGKVAEIEHGEVGFVDQEGSLNIFGKMKVPGTNKSFKKAAKDMAAAQLKVDKKRGYYSQILNNSDNTDDYQDSAISTAKVMLKSLDNQAQQIKKDKEGLASYQNLILDLAGKNENMMKYGGRLKMEDGGGIDPNDPKSVQAIIDKYSGGKAPLKAEDFIEVSQKYGVPLDLMLAQAIQESSIGTKGMATRSHNIFNVKNNGNTGRLTDQGSWKQGLENYAKLIRDEYTTDGKTVDVGTLLSTDFKRPKKGGFYAEEKGAYTGRLRTLIQEINPNASYQYSSASNNAAGDPGDEFKQFKGKDGKQYNSPAGLKPSVFYKDPAIAKALEADQTFPKAGADANWGPEHDKLWNSLPQEKRDELLNKSKTPAPTDKPVSNTPPDNSALEYKPKYEQIVKIDGTKDTPYGPAQKDPTQFRDKVNIGTGDRKRGWLSPLAIEQIAPELLTVATNKRQAVPQLSYQPELKQTFDISYQLGRNENQSSFNQVAKIAENTGNVDALSALAANLYKANEQYNMQEVQGNAQQKLGVYGQNVDTLNDAKLKNLQLIESQQNKQAAADYNTWKTDIAAFTSVAGKELQNKLENKTYNAYANLFRHYGFDKKGNVTFNPDDVVTRFNEGEAQQFGLLAAQKGLKDVMEAGSKTATTYDKDGNIKKVTSIDADLEEFNSIWNSKNLDEAQKRTILGNRKNSIFESLNNKQ